MRIKRQWTGTIVGLCCLPILEYFINRGQMELGIAVVLALGTSAIAVILHWKMKKHVWFWATIAVVLALHALVATHIHWTRGAIHTIAFPLAVADFFIYSGAIRLAEKLFLKDPGEEDEDWV